MKIRIEEATLVALVNLAQSAIDADAHDKTDADTLRSQLANETDLSGDLKTKIDALVAPAAPAAGQ